MATRRECDLCERRISEDNPIVAKLFFSPVKTEGNGGGNSNDYTLHADVGQCCATKVNQWKWQKRETRKQSPKRRRLRAVND